MFEDLLQQLLDFLQEQFVTPYGLLGIFIVMFLTNATLFLPVPGYLLLLAVSGMFNPVLLSAVASLGASLGELVGYAIGYSSRKRVLSRKFKLEQTEETFKEYGLWSIFLFAVSPLPFDVVGILSGILEVNVLVFFVLTFFGKFVFYTVLVLEGQTTLDLVKQVLAGEVSLATVLLFIVLLVVIVLSFMISKRYKQ